MISFLLLPLYTSYISPKAYGTYDLNITYAILFASFFFLDIWTGIMKYVFEKNNDDERNMVVYNGICIFLSSAIMYVVIMWIFGVTTEMEYLYGVVSYGFFLCLQNLYGYLARSFHHNSLFAVSGLVSTAANAAINIVLLMFAHMDYNALYIAYAVGIVLQCAMIESKIKIWKSFRLTYLNWGCLIELLRFSLPLCINSLCYWLLTGYNKVVIKEYLDVTANGYYAIASKFGGILVIVTSCFSMAWQELAYENYEKSEETGYFYSVATNWYIKAMFVGFILLLPCISLAYPVLIDSDYMAARTFVPMNMLATMSGIIFIFLGNIISTYKRNNVVFLSTLAACIVNIICIYSLIGQFQVEAANLALLSGYLVSNMIRVVIIRREIPYRLDKTMLFYMVPIVVVYIMFYRQNNYVIDFVSFVLALVTAFIIFRKYLFGFIIKKG